jgi:hypothetical protein
MLGRHLGRTMHLVDAIHRRSEMAEEGERSTLEEEADAESSKSKTDSPPQRVAALGRRSSKVASAAVFG